MEEDTQHGDDETFQVATEEKATISECNQDKVNAEKPIGHNLAKEGNAVKIDGNKKRKKKKKKKAISSSQEKAENVPNIQPAFKKPVNIAGKSNQKKNVDEESYSLGMTDERLKAYGFNPKKFKNQQKFGKTKIS